MSRQSADDFDILSEVDSGSTKNDVFLVTFDLFTPRAHFVIMARDRDRWSDIGDMRDADKRQVVQTAMSTTSALDLRTATLSVHRGAWINTRHFHCHVCTDVDKYLDVFQNLSREPPMSQWWPNARFVTRQWKAAKDKTMYPRNVRGYPYSSYKRDEIKDIEKTSPTGPGLSTFKDHSVVYHQQERRIGIAGSFGSDLDGISTTLGLLEDLARSLGIVKGSKHGCHVCVDLTGKGFDGFVSSEPVQGYLQVDGPMMYENCPREQRKAWLESYKDRDFEDKVYT